MKRLRIIEAVTLFGMLAFFLYFVNSNIIATEARIANGTPLYLSLAPRDPRSLIQGDYMTLTYAVERDAERVAPGSSRGWRGQVVATVDEDNVAHFARFHDGSALANDEILLNYRYRDSWRGMRIGVDSYFFQEGLADVYDTAQYAEVRVGEGGSVLLINLVDEDFNVLGP